MTTTPTWLKYLSYFVVGSIILAYLFRFITPTQVSPPQLIEKNYEGSTTTFSNAQYVGDPIYIPESLPTATATYSEINETQMEEKLTTRFNLVKNQTVVDLWESEDFTLIKGDGEIPSYLLMSKNLPTKRTSFSEPTAIEAATAISKEILDSELQVYPQSIQYFLTEGPEFSSAEKSSAQMIALDLGYSFNNFALYPNLERATPITVYLDSEYKLARLEIAGYYLASEPQRSYKSLSINHALQNINDDHGIIITQEYYGYSPLSLTEVTSAVFNEASVEYRAGSVDGVVLPYYKFSGTLINSDNQEFTASVITPAIQTNFEIDR